VELGCTCAFFGQKRNRLEWLATRDCIELDGVLRRSRNLDMKENEYRWKSKTELTGIESLQ
jgi:hypothetical protein